MSAAAALDYTYRYPFASQLGETGRGPGLRLATCGGRESNPHFFEGKLLYPQVCGEMLLTLSDVVRSHFFLPRPALLDPVVTSHEEVVRFEGFSGCCGAYARVDLPAESFEADLVGRGTTNVDFNQPMRASLSRMRDRDAARLAVGQDAVSLERSGEAVVEKKVKLPVRWLKGFCEVQAYQPGLRPVLEASGAEARRFVRALPKTGGSKRTMYVIRRGRALTTTQREGKDTVAFHGPHRVRMLEPIMRSATKLVIWADDSGTSGWQVHTDAGRFLLLLSPEVYRGFSGEGQALQQLATGEWEDALPAVQAQLSWQPRLDGSTLASKADCSVEQARSALAVLGSRGVVGYDIESESYFHRQLPFDLDSVEMLQPRLRSARKLVADGRVEIVSNQGDDIEAKVGGTGVTHLVRLSAEADRCTCPWFSKHQGDRGPCKHVLAARLVVDGDDEESES